jgi:hypothetical protein
MSGAKTETLPAPMTPPACDLSDFGYMPLDVRRLRDSSLASKAKGEEFRCAVMLWCASWHQVPAASLPDDDDELAQFAGFGRVVSAWLEVKKGALRGWIKCSDGRLYHPVVAEKAREAWFAKLKNAWQRECDRIRKENKRREEKKMPLLGFPPEPKLNSDGTIAVSAGITEDTYDSSKGIPKDDHAASAGNPPENALKGEERRDKGKEREKESSLQHPDSKTSTSQISARASRKSSANAPPRGEVFPDGNGEERRGKPSFKIEPFLLDTDLEDARAAAPGWDIYALTRQFDQSVNSGAISAPNRNPGRAFVEWCRKVKGIHPDRRQNFQPEA